MTYTDSMPSAVLEVESGGFASEVNVSLSCHSERWAVRPHVLAETRLPPPAASCTDEWKGNQGTKDGISPPNLLFAATSVLRANPVHLWRASVMQSAEIGTSDDEEEEHCTSHGAEDAAQKHESLLDGVVFSEAGSAE